LQDVHATATTSRRVMSRPEIQASAVATVRRGLPLSDASGPVEVAQIGFVTPLASLTLAAVRAFAMALVVAALFAICNPARLRVPSRAELSGAEIVYVGYPRRSTDSR